MNNELKEAFEEFYTACENIPFHNDLLTDKSLKEIIQNDILQFLMYLLPSYKACTYQEASFIYEFSNFDYTPEQIDMLIRELNIHGKEFSNTPLLGVSIITQLIGTLSENEKYLSYCKSMIGTYFTFLLCIGKDFIIYNDLIESIEIQKFKDYINMMTTYVTFELKKYNLDIAFSPVDDKIDEEFDIIEFHDKETFSDYAEIKPPTHENLQELLSQLNNLVGLKSVKNDVTSLINLLQIRQMRKERGMKLTPISLHLVFSGNPGTGKTTVARLLAKIYYKLGVLSKGHLVEVNRSGMVAGYVGQTAIKVQEVIQKALGGILFIDEAYSLTVNRGESDFGFEAVDTLLKGMEDYRDDLIVIVAGYPDLMNEFLNSNPGLRSRFNKFINFTDYIPQELLQIFENLCDSTGYTASEKCKDCVKTYFEQRYATRDINFANGRDVRNYFEIAMMNQANRLSILNNISNEMLLKLELEDVVNIKL